MPIRRAGALLPRGQLEPQFGAQGVEGGLVGFVIDGAEDQGRPDEQNEAADHSHAGAPLHQHEDFVKERDQVRHEARKAHRQVEAYPEETAQTHCQEAEDDHREVKRDGIARIGQRIVAGAAEHGHEGCQADPIAGVRLDSLLKQLL